MLLYKFVPTQEIANQVAKGVFRFYELKKYLKIEENTGRADAAEGSISFLDDGSLDFIRKLPTASFNGIEFQCQSISLSQDYLEQFFVFCMSTEKTKPAIGDCKFAVELDTDIFSTFEKFLNTGELALERTGGEKFFSHGRIDYYDIDNHPPSIENEKWREIYTKSSSFCCQKEYRAVLKASDTFFQRTKTTHWFLERAIFKSSDGSRLPFNFKLEIRSGVDVEHWRYLEFDVSEFQTNIFGNPSEIITFD